MKRSKIFLVATTSLLAVVGFISAKAHRHFGSINFWTSSTARNPANCTVAASSDNSSTVFSTGEVQQGVTKYSSPCAGKPVYTGEQ